MACGFGNLKAHPQQYTSSSKAVPHKLPQLMPSTRGKVLKCPRQWRTLHSSHLILWPPHIYYNTHKTLPPDEQMGKMRTLYWANFPQALIYSQIPLGKKSGQPKLCWNNSKLYLCVIMPANVWQTEYSITEVTSVWSVLLSIQLLVLETEGQRGRKNTVYTTWVQTTFLERDHTCSSDEISAM